MYRYVNHLATSQAQCTWSGASSLCSRMNWFRSLPILQDWFAFFEDDPLSLLLPGSLHRDRRARRRDARCLRPALLGHPPSPGLSTTSVARIGMCRTLGHLPYMLILPPFRRHSQPNTSRILRPHCRAPGLHCCFGCSVPLAPSRPSCRPVSISQSAYWRYFRHSRPGSNLYVRITGPRALHGSLIPCDADLQASGNGDV